MADAKLKAEISKLKSGKRMRFLIAKGADGEPVLLLEMGKPKLPDKSKKVAEGFAIFEDKSIVLITGNDGDAEKYGKKVLKAEGLGSQPLIARKPLKGEEEEAGATTDTLAELLAEIEQLQPAVDKALLTADDKTATMLKGMFGIAHAQAAGGNESMARKALGKVKAALEQATPAAGATAAAATTEAAPAESAPPQEDRAVAWKRDTKDTFKLLLRAQREKLGDPPRLQMIWELALGKAAAGDYDKAYALLAKLQKELATAKPQDETSSTKEFVDVEESAAMFEQALGTWQSALATAQMMMNQAKQYILTDPEFQGLDSWDTIQASAKSIDASLKEFNSGLDALLASAQGEEDPTAAKKSAKTKIGQYRAQLDQEIIAAVDEAYGLSVRATLEGALGRVESLLA